MAVEQDWAAYANQSILNDSDTLLARTAAGAGVEVPGSALLKKDGSGNVNLSAGTPTAAGVLRYFDIYNEENTNGNSGAIVRLITKNAAGSANTTVDLVKFRNGLFYVNNNEPISGSIAFAINNVEGARLSTTREWLVGTGSASGLYNGSAVRTGVNLDPGGVVCAQNNTGSCMWLSKAAGYSNGTLAAFGVNGATVGSISTTGSSTAYNTSSDYRLKDDYQPLTGALDRILSLPVYDFRWIATGERARGFKAHEYGGVIPGAATGQKDGMREEEYEIEPARASDVLGPDGSPVIIPAVMGKRTVPDYQGIDQSKAVPDLVGAVQELAALVEHLRAEVAALKAA